MNNKKNPLISKGFGKAEKIYPVDCSNDRMMIVEKLRLPRRNVDFSWKVKSPQEKQLIKLHKKLNKIKGVALIKTPIKIY